MRKTGCKVQKKNVLASAVSKDRRATVSCGGPAVLHDVVGDHEAAAMDEGDHGGEVLDRHAHERGELLHEVVEGEEVEAPLQFANFIKFPTSK